MANLKRTALYDAHVKAGGQIVDFCGWELPIKYEGIIEEHQAVRNAVGIFDVSHMGEVDIKGKQAFDFVQNLITNDISKLKDNQVLYTLMCYPDGGVVDDLLVYKFSNEYFYLVINAANVDKDYKWMVDNKKDYDIDIKNISGDITPLEGGLGFFVKLDKDDFIGKQALAKQKAEGLKRRLRGFEMIDRGIPREGYEVFSDGKKIGFVTTGYYSPTLKKNIGLALIDFEYSKGL